MADAVGSQFAPGVMDQLEAQAAGVSVEAVKAAAKKPKHNVVFLDNRETRKAITLEWPLSFNGREFRRIFIQRLTLAQVGDYMDRLNKVAETDPDAVVRLPMFVDENGDDLPEGLWESLMDDDVGTLEKAALDFLPRRFQAATKATEEAKTSDSDNLNPGASSAA